LSPVIEHPQILLYSRIRKSPFFYASRRHGVAMYSVYNHMYHPRHYGDPVAEYWQLLEGVTLWDVGVERQVEITGPDAFAFTDMLVARDLAKCEVGQCKYVFVTAPDRGIINDPARLRLGEGHFCCRSPTATCCCGRWGWPTAPGSTSRSGRPDVGPVQIQGPTSKDVMVELFGEAVLEVPYYFLRRYRLAGMPVLLASDRGPRALPQALANDRAGVRADEVQPAPRPLQTTRTRAVRAEWRLITATHNLLKLHRHALAAA
jgi:glycine cleavage system aminomethyltransferase T